MKEVKYFVSELNRINEGLKNRGLDANNVVNIVIDNSSIFSYIVFYKEN